MYRPGGDLPQFRPGGVLPVAPPAPGMNMGPAFVPPPMPGRAFLMPQFSRGLPGFPPPPVPVPIAIPAPVSVSVRVPVPPPPPPLPSGQPPPFLPPLPHSPPADVPPPPPAGPPPSPPPPPSEDSSAVEQLPPEPHKPNDPEMLKNIEVLAAFVAKNGPQFESMARAKQAGDPKFAFLFESEVGSEAVTGHEYYKWKKHTLELHLRLEAENKVNKHLDQGKLTGRIQQANRAPGQPVLLEEAPGSPTMSDMDMEDDFATPSPKGDAKVRPSDEAEKLSPRRAGSSAEAHNFLQQKAEASEIKKFRDVLEHPVLSEEPGMRARRGKSPQTVQLTRVHDEKREHHEKTHFLDMREPIQGWETDDRTGLNMNASFSDTSDASGDWEPPKTAAKTGNKASDLGRSRTEQDLQREGKAGILDRADNVPPLKLLSRDADKPVRFSDFGRSRTEQDRQREERIEMLDRADNVPPLKLISHDADKPVRFSDLGRSRTEQERQREERTGILDQADNIPPRKFLSQDADKPVRFPDLPVKQVMPVSLERPVSKVSRWGDPGPTQRLQPVKEVQLQDSSDELNINEPSEGVGRGRRGESASPSHHNSFSDANNTSKDWERSRSSDGNGGRGLEDGRFGADPDQHIEQEAVTVDEFGRLVREGASESESDGGRPPPSRKRRSFSRSRSRSPGKIRRRRQTFSRSPRRSFSRSPSRSFSRSPRRSFSRSPRRSFSPSVRRRGRWSQSHSRSPRWRRSLSRTPPRDSRWGGMGRGEWDWRGDREFQERGRRGGRGGGPNICFNYARGRCFRGSSCRYLHQDRRTMVQERDFLMQEARAERPEADFSIGYTEVDKEIDVVDKPEFEAAQKSDGAENVRVDEVEEPGVDMEVSAAVQMETPTQGKAEEKGEVGIDLELVKEPEVKETEVSIEADVALKPELSSEAEGPEKPKVNITELGSAEFKTELDSAEVRTEVGSAEVRTEVGAEVRTEVGPAEVKTEVCSAEVKTEVGVTKKLDAGTDVEWALPEEDESPGQPHQGEASGEVGKAKKLDARSETEWSLPQEDESRGQPRQSEPSRVSIPALAPLPAAILPPMLPLSQPKSMGQSIPLGNPALMGQPYTSTGQLYPPGNLAPGLQQQSSTLHHPLPPSGNVQPYAQASSLRQPLNNSNLNIGPNFPIQNPNLLQPFPVANQLSNLQPSLVSGNSGPRPPYPMGSSGPGQQAFLPGPPPMRNMPPLPQNQGPPILPYGTSFPGQSSFGQNQSLAQNPSLGQTPSFTQNPNLSHNPPFAQILNFSQNPSHGQNTSLPQNASFAQNPSFAQNQSFVQNPTLPNQPVFPPRNEPLNFPSNPPFLQQHGIPTNSASTLAPVQNGFNSNLSLPNQQSVFSHPFAGETSKQFTFPSQPQDVYPRPALPVSAPPIQNPTQWVLPASHDSPVKPVSALPATKGRSTSYIYPLTTIPPLSNLIRLPGVSDVSTSADQYDPLSDSLDPGPPGALKSMAYNPPKLAEDGKFASSLSNAMGPRLENVSPGPVVEKTNILIGKPDGIEADIANINEAAADPGVGIVENVSPPDDNRNWSPGQPVEGAEIGQDQAQSKVKKSNRGLKLLRSAVAEYVKEVLKPTWREGHMTKEAFKTIAKKAVDKVTGTLPSHHIPKSQEKVDQFMASSRSKISKLVQGYVDKYLKS